MNNTLLELIKTRSICIRKLSIYLDAINLMLDENNLSELDLTINRKKETICEYSLNTKAINDLLKTNSLIHSNLKIKLKEQDLSWHDYLNKDKQTIKKTRNIIEKMQTNLKSISNHKKIKNAYN